ncbi:hypothetical protein NPIL_414341 [Nephila pilipes]|uniref:Uncharacterized protein n=1 Tax=Nephila pilipes TaxID=299642 RepID=A0A8X6NHR9_NEPPI|nr:hypothetical protein NPIL_414341 [Nephila pilipes]
MAKNYHPEVIDREPHTHRRSPHSEQIMKAKKQKQKRKAQINTDSTNCTCPNRDRNFINNSEQGFLPQLKTRHDYQLGVLERKCSIVNMSHFRPFN